MTKFFSFGGRIGRLGFWRVQLYCTLLAAAVWALGAFSMIAFGPPGGIVYVFLAPIFSVLLANYFRRLHDRGKTAYWALIFVAAPMLCQAAASEIIGQQTQVSILLGLVLSLCGLGLSLWGLVETGFRKGERRSNRFGEDPLPA